MLLATSRLLRKSPEQRTPSNASRTISNAHLSFLVWSSLFAPIPLFAIAFLQHGAAGYAITFAHIDGKAVFSILFQAYPTTLFGYWIWNVLLKKYPVSTVAPLSLLVPIFGMLGSVAIVGKHVGLPKILATLFIVLGLAIGLYGKYLGLPFAKRARA
ncbi:EamA family transporter [Burkholderia vietnamiensis]|uniref:EamA family transporter n=1 Tax=Burkholderia vietnamiensis TaxID=60552 RepID=UPI000A9A35FA|nr:EamA family transporter [Burkholderia vietnamiensis]